MTLSSNLPDWPDNVSTTWPAPKGILLRVERDEDYVIVHDSVGLRYGHAQTLVEAVTEWAHHVQFICSEPEDKLGDPLLSEARAYKRALEGIGL